MKEDLLAYCSSHQTKQHIQILSDDLKLQHSSIKDGGYLSALQDLARIDSPNVLLIEFDTTEQIQENLMALANVVEPKTHVIVLGPSVPLVQYRAICALGVLEYVETPLDMQLLRRLCASCLTVDEHPDNEKTSGGQVIAVSGLQGGVGCTMLSAAIAHQLSQEGCYTLTAQLDDTRGDLNLYWQVLDKKNAAIPYVDAALLQQEQVIKRAVHELSSRLNWLACKNTNMASNSDIDTLNKQLSHQFSYLVWDCGYNHVHAQTLWRTADICVWVCEPSVSLVQRWEYVKSVLGNTSKARHIFVVNQTRPERSKQISSDNLEALFEQQIISIPYAHKTPSVALNTGHVELLLSGKIKSSMCRLTDKIQLKPSSKPSSFLQRLSQNMSSPFAAAKT